MISLLLWALGKCLAWTLILTFLAYLPVILTISYFHARNPARRDR